MFKWSLKSPGGMDPEAPEAREPAGSGLSRTQAKVTANKKSAWTTQPTFPSKDKNQKEEGMQP